MIVLSITVTAQVTTQGGTLQAGSTYQAYTATVKDSTTVTQNFNKPPYNIVNFKSQEGDTATYIMTSTFMKKYRTIPPMEVPATSYAEQNGGIVVVSGVLGGVDKTDWIRYNLNLSGPIKSIEYTYAMADATTGAVEFRVESITGAIIAESILTPTGGWSTYRTVTIPIGGGGYGANMNINIYVTFTKSVRTTGSGGNIQKYRFIYK